MIALGADSFVYDLGVLLTKVAVLLVIAEGVTRLMRRSSAAGRHLVWSAALVAALALPIAAAILPSFGPGLIPAPEILASPAAQRDEATIGRSGEASLDRTEGPGAGEPVAGTTAPAGAEDARRAPTRSAAASTARSWSAWVALGWAAGALALAIRLAVGIVQARRMARRGRSPDPAVSRVVDSLCDGLGVDRIEAVVHHAADVPMVWGIRWPVLVLPTAVENWSSDRLRAVVLHELAHVRRGDCLSQLAASAAVIVNWVNPLAWRAAGKLRAEREFACDALVLQSGVRGSEYARHLLDIARGARGGGAVGAVALPMARPSQLEGRLLAILNAEEARRDVGRLLRVAVPIAALAVMAPLAALQPWAEAAEPAESTPAGPAATGSDEPANRAEPPAATPAELPGSAAAESAMEPAVETTSTNPGESATQDDAARQAARDRARMALERALTDDDRSVRSNAAHALGNLEDSRSVPALIGALSDESPRVRAQVAWALGMIESSDAVPGLTGAAATESDATVLSQIAWALGMIESDAGVDALRALATASRAEVRSQAAWALGMIESPAGVDVAVGLLSDGSENVRNQAAWALGMIESDLGVDGLVAALADESVSVRKTACWALGMIESEAALDALLDAMENDDREVQKAAMEAVARILR